MDFRPKEVVFYKDASGKVMRLETWNYDTLAGVELAGMLMNLLWLIFVAFLIAPFFLYVTISMFCGRFNFLNVIGALVGCWVLYDASQGGLLTCGMNILFSEKVFNYIIILNAISVVLHIFLAVFGTITHKLIVDNLELEKTRVTIFCWIMFILGLITYHVQANKLNLHPGWMQKNIDTHIKEITRPQEIKDSLDHLIELKRMDDYDKSTE